jgi:filamentous hemagglutinin
VPTPGLSHYQSGYEQGAAAGVVQFAAPSLVLGGHLQANAVYGPYQRGISGSATLGGTLIIGTPRGSSNVNISGQADYFAPAVTVTLDPTPVVVADTASLPPQTLQLPVEYLTSDGFSNTQIYTNTSFLLPAKLPLQLPSGGSLLVQASRIDIDSSITDLGGSLNFQSALTVADLNPLGTPTLGPGYPRLGIGVGDGVTLDVSGLWTNDSVFAGGIGTALTLQNAGSINLQLTLPASELVLGDRVALKADGGAWEQNNASLVYGKGGSITLDASPSQSAVQFGQALSVEAFGVYTATGGSLALLAPRFDISQGSGKAWTEAQSIDDLNTPGQSLSLFAPLFSDYGFSNIAVTATGAAPSSSASDVLIVEGSGSGAPGTTINAQALSLQLMPGYQTRASGGTIAGFSQEVTLPANLRPATNVSLNALRLADDTLLGSTGYGSIDIQAGATILGDPGASLSIEGEGNIAIGGTLRAPGGSVSVLLASPTSIIADQTAADKVDPGYLADLGISLSPTAIIDVSGGSAILTPNNQGLLLGTVNGGGSVVLNAQRGTVVVESGSSIDFSGSSATLDVTTLRNGYTREVVGSAGGSLTVSSPESIELLGNLQGKAGVGTGGVAAAGSLEIDLARLDVIPGQPDPNGEPLQIALVGTTPAVNLPPVVDLATISISQIADSGIDSLILNAGGIAPGLISMQTSQPLALNRSVIFETQSLSVADGIAAVVSAPYVQIGNPLTLLSVDVTQPAPTAGTGSLLVNANQLTLLGNLTLQGIGNATFTSQGDVQLQGTLASSPGMESGSLLTAGDLTILAARVYPDTFTSFTIQALGGMGSASGGNVNIDQVMINGQPAPSPGLPLSAGGSVSIVAENIEVGGTLLAPFGEIALSANNSLTLSNGSLVSVSGTGLDVPFGQTQQNGQLWLYQNPSGAPIAITATPSKQVSLTAPNITVQSSATVDLRGGGDLYAYEWVPGTGGLQDSLAGSGSQSIPGLYAILPGQRGQAAPFDPQESGSSNPTQTVYLSGGAGVVAGYYALLPPRYALAPGASLIQIEPGYSSASGGQIGSLADGTPVVAGYLSSAGTALHTGSTVYEGFAVYPGGYGQQLATYNISNASTYFAAAAVLAGTGPVPEPGDAGSLTFSVLASNSLLGNSFNLQGTVQTSAAAGGRGALINISAPDLEVTAGGAASSPDFVAVSGSVLQSWNAGAITLGGAANDTSVAVAANNVIVDSGVNLTADQIFVVAQQSIDIKGSLASTSGSNGTTLPILPAAETLTLSNPGAALVAVSDIGLPIAARSGSGTGATITLESGSSLSTGGALALDAPGSILLNGVINGKGASWSLASNSVAFVGSGSSPDSLNIDSNLVASLQTAGAVRISSQGNIDLYAPVTLGAGAASVAPTLSSLTLLGSQLNNIGGGDSVFGAANLILGGVSAAPASPGPVAGSGTLSLVADNLQLVSNVMGISGYGSTVAQIAGTVSSASGSISGLNVGGDLTINAVELTPGSGSQTTIAASGQLTLGAPTASAKGTAPTTLVGGELTLAANSIVDQGAIAAPSGLVYLNATAGDLELGGTGSIDVAGTMLQAVNQQAASPGGMVALSASGNLVLDAGSMISVAGEQQAPAGSLSLTGGGMVSLGGVFNGKAGSGGTGGTGGSFTLDAGQLAGGLTPLAAALTQGGFSNAVNVRVRGGDLQLNGGGIIDANSITLTADTGAVDIAGVLNATSGAQRGLIDLSAGTSVRLDASGQLHADGTGTSELGGEIQINSTCASCSITLAPGSVITAAGTNQMGQLILRAPATADGSDVAINLGSAGIGADVSRVGQVVIDAVTTLQTTAGTINADLANAITSASSFLTNSSTGITARLTSGATPMSVQAGVELQDANVETLTLQGLTDLSTLSDPGNYSQAPQVVNVTVRAAGSLNINGTISDGFITDPTGNSDLLALSSLPSATFSFVAGADTGSANALSVMRGGSANLTLMSSAQPSNGSTDGIGPSVIRTGTGDINLAAAGNIVFASAGGGAAAVYTAGSAPDNVLGPVSYGNGALIQNFGSNGGNVRLAAGGDVVGSPVGASFPRSDGGNFGVSGWQLHQGSPGLPAQYGIDYAAFDWNVGALGGGDVTVTAGSNVRDLSAATADSLVSGDNTRDGKSAMYGAGGGLSITAGGDIGSAQLFVADGVGTIIAGGGLIPTRTSPRVGNSGGLPVGSSIAEDNAQISVWARNAVQVDAIYNPTLPAQVNAGQDSSLNGGFLTYGPNSAVNLSSTSGAVTLELSSAANGTMSTLLGTNAVVRGDTNLLIAPPTLAIQALQGDIIVSGGPQLAPASDGQLSLFAGRDIRSGTTGSNNQFTLSDALLSTIPTSEDPALLGKVNVPFQGVIHSGDSTPALITAGRDIVNINFSIPKPADIVAGRDIVNLGFAGQNISASDVTLISAGRDLVTQGTGTTLGIQLSGPGSIDVLAGRNLNLGFGNGIVTLGNLVNANLATSQGASADLMVGYGTQQADLSGFVNQIIAPSTTYQSQLVAYVESLEGTSGLTFGQAESQFAGLSTSQQSALVDNIFFNELLLSGRAANSGSGAGFQQGYNAIDALFPGSRTTSGGSTSPHAGDLTLTSSQIYTDSGGNISILVPGGKIDVGLANPPSTIVAKPASQLGIVAEGTGNVSIYTAGDVNVNKSRVFTLGGGNILIWSDEGSIDAGNGSKSSLSVPPPTVSVNQQGVVTLNFGGSLAAGSGIRTIQTNSSVPPGNVDLDAPVGTVDAGDAGIGAAGNINIAAAHVIGVDNINFGGSATGVPSDLSSLGASLSGVSAAAASATSSSTASVAEANAAKETVPLAQTALNWLDVFVTGLGEENCKQDDIECLKRQRAAAP